MSTWTLFHKFNLRNYLQIWLSLWSCSLMPSHSSEWISTLETEKGLLFEPRLRGNWGCNTPLCHALLLVDVFMYECTDCHARAWRSKIAFFTNWVYVEVSPIWRATYFLKVVVPTDSFDSLFSSLEQLIPHVLSALQKFIKLLLYSAYVCLYIMLI